ncbi:MAG: nuclear transport factor 2 family protein [Actinomycetia bacterium]|nr:nuclear transport factor 2 family protein [Actinomycetes bacterium]
MVPGMTSTLPADTADLARRFAAAAGSADPEVVRPLFTDDAAIWHNVDGVTQSLDEMLVMLQWVATNLVGLRYADVRLHPTPTGWVQQHELQATTADGRAVAVPACLVFTVRDGRIAHLEEYLNSGSFGGLTKAE